MKCDRCGAYTKGDVIKIVARILAKKAKAASEIDLYVTAELAKAELCGDCSGLLLGLWAEFMDATPEPQQAAKKGEGK